MFSHRYRRGLPVLVTTAAFLTVIPTAVAHASTDSVTDTKVTYYSNAAHSKIIGVEYVNGLCGRDTGGESGYYTSITVTCS